MAGINLGSAAGDILFCNSCLRESESGVPRYVALHSNSPVFLTEHMNMTKASFWPFLIKSCSSMRLINAFGPCPSKTGRYIGSAVSCSGRGTLTCDQTKSKIDNKVISENANTRMRKYASGKRHFFKRNLAKT